VRRVAARKVRRRAALEAEVERVAQFAPHAPGPDVVELEGSHRRRLVPARLAVDHEHALDRHAGERLGHELRRRRAVRADQAERRLGRVGEGPEQV